MGARCGCRHVRHRRLAADWRPGRLPGPRQRAARPHAVSRSVNPAGPEGPGPPCTRSHGPSGPGPICRSPGPSGPGDRSIKEISMLASQNRYATSLVSLTAPDSFTAEPYQGLRLKNEGLRQTKDLRTIGISSPGEGDGKTVTAINLAGALAQGSTSRVLLVDGDFRRHSLGG